MEKKGQQEIMGFVLIVVMVVIALLIFLVISIKNPTGGLTNQNDTQVSNIQSSVLAFTTNCTISNEPESVSQLVKSCYENKKCEDGKTACDSLNKTVVYLMRDLNEVDNSVNSWEYVMAWESQDSRRLIQGFKEGKCNTTIRSAEEIISVGSNVEDGVVRVSLKVC